MPIDTIVTDSLLTAAGKLVRFKPSLGGLSRWGTPLWENYDASSGVVASSNFFFFSSCRRRTKPARDTLPFWACSSAYHLTAATHHQSALKCKPDEYHEWRCPDPNYVHSPVLSSRLLRPSSRLPGSGGTVVYRYFRSVR